MRRLKQLIHEIHRRSLWQVLGPKFVFVWLPILVTPLSACGDGDPTSTAPEQMAAEPTPPEETVLIDEAHHNLHTLAGTLGRLATILRSDGYYVVASTTSFTADALARGKVLVISNALHARNAGGDWSLPTPSAFSALEVQEVEAWVREGGSLLLIADHMPFPGAAESLAAAFGVTFNNGFAFDKTQLSQPSTCLAPHEIQIFRRSDSSLADHVITNGRSAEERIDSVATFTGQAFEPDEITQSLMVFGPTAVSWMPEVAWEFDQDTPEISVDGWRQGTVRAFGQGRVALFGEAAMFTLQMCGDGLPMGMNAPAASQNQQFILNLVRWLFGEL